jgi:hypothetical protein
MGFLEDIVISLSGTAGFWSGREDSNLRHPAPKAGALARLRYAPNEWLILEDIQIIDDIFFFYPSCPYPFIS